MKSRARGFESHPLRRRGASRSSYRSSLRSPERSPCRSRRGSRCRRLPRWAPGAGLALAFAAVSTAGNRPAAAPLPGRTGAPASSSITVATWNIAWFGDGRNDDDLTGNHRGGRHLRNAGDVERLRGVVARLVARGVDAVGLQEIENRDAARLLFPEGEWDLFVSKREPDPEWRQRTVIAVRRASGWQAERHPDVLEWSPQGRDRHGVDLTLRRGGERVRLLTVHFQSGCNREPLTSGKRQCGFLRMQFAVLKGWLYERFREGIPVVIAGDWNRFLSRRADDAALLPGDPLVLPTVGSAPRCWDGYYDNFVDHLVAFGPGGTRPGFAGFAEVLYEAPFSERDRFSDHCPVVAELVFDTP